jgi:hypothetical protein
MAFGQPSGPPASAKQLKELVDLLRAAGHVDFPDARGPLGFTQRQAGGKFTRDEADHFIARLQEEADVESPTFTQKNNSGVKLLSNVSSDDLAAELQSRGWVVMEP